MTELAVAYVSIVPETSRIAPGIRAALNQGESAASSSGQRMGSAMSTAIGTALGIGVSKAAGLATRTISDALKGGFERLNTLEKANIQFRNMGLSASQTQRQINDLNDIVSGTSTSLSDAAGAAAMLGGAGVKSGKDMNDAVKALVNVSSASGAAAKDIGLVMMQIKASGRLLGGDALQLAQRGVPIYDLVAKSIGKTTAEVRKMGEQGQISFDMVVKAINDGTGNLAKEMGATLPAKLANLRTAMNRLTAAGMEPFLLRAKSGATDLTNAVNTLTPKVKDFAIALDEKIFDEWGPKIKAALESFEKTGSIDELKTTLIGLWDAMKDGIQATSGIRASLMQASAALGVSGWQILLVALQAATGALNALNPLLSALGNLMQSHQGIVTALAGAFLLFKTIPGIMGRVTTSLAPMGSALSTARSSVAGFGSAWRTSIGYMQQANPAMSTFGAGVRVLGSNAGAAAKGGLGMLKNAGSAVAGVFGGPVGLGLTAAAVGGTYMAAQFQEARQKTEALAAANRDLVTAQHDVLKAFVASRGAVTDNVISAQTSAVDKYRETLDATAARHKSFMEGLATFDTHRGQTNALADEAEAAQRAFDKLGLSNEELTKRISRGDESRNQLRNQLRAMGPDGQSAARAFDEISISYVQQQQRARTLTPGVAELGDAIRAMGDEGASAGDKLNALKAAMDALNPARNKTEAMAQYGEAIRQAVTAAQGIDGSAFDGAGNIDAMSEAGGKLSDTLKDLADKSAQVASTGGDMTAVNRENEKTFQALAEATGQPIEKIRELYAELGGQTVDLTVSLSGAPKVIQDLGTVSEAFRKTPNSKTVTMDAGTVTPQTMDLLRRMNATVTTMPNGDIQITANDAIAQQRIMMVTRNVNVLNALKANPTLDLNTLQFNAKDAQSRGILQQLNGMVADPQAGLIIQDLLNGQAVSMTKLDELRRSTANPNAILLIDELLKNAGIANTTLDQTARTRDANIRVNVVPGTNGVPGAYQFGLNVPAGANGMIRQYANGGIHALEQYANGKLPDQAVVQKAMPHSLIQWAEPETGGEAFIPLASGKRGRSTSILSTVAKMFGYQLVPQDSLPSTFSGIAGAIAGQLFGSTAEKFLHDRRPGQADSPWTSARKDIAALVGGGRNMLLHGRYDGSWSDRFRIEEDNPIVAGLMGAQRMAKFADGGILGADAFRELAEGKGASRPLTGAPYVWGGVDWGDCSATGSAFARLWAGLDPMGGRTTTAGAAAYFGQLGLTQGRGTSGDLQIGFYNGGAGGGHMTTKLPTGENAEMGGGNGGGMLGGGAADPNDPQFTDHWFGKVGPSLPAGGGVDPGGFVVRPDGTIEYQPGNGNFGATGSGSSSTGSTTGGGTSISSRFGSVVGAFVEGQIADVFQTLGANDSPGILGALAAYENSQRSQQSGGVDAGALKQSYEKAKLESQQKYDDEKRARDREYETERDKLQAEKKATKDAARKAEIDAKLDDLKRKHEDTEAAKKKEHDDNSLAAKQKYDDASKSFQSANGAAAQQQAAVTDPGTSKPAPGQDLGGAAAAGIASTGNQIKDAFRSGLRSAWQQGQPWIDTDWIIGKESSWKPDARNGKYFGLPQAGPEVYEAAGKSPTTTDPKEQGEVFDHYVDERYADPAGARRHWEANNWYDSGGVGVGTGLMAKNVLRPERVLSPRQTEAFEQMVTRNFQSGVGTDQIIAKLDQLIGAVLSIEGGGAPTFRDEREYNRLMQRRQNARATAARGGR